MHKFAPIFIFITTSTIYFYIFPYTSWYWSSLSIHKTLIHPYSEYVFFSRANTNGCYIFIRQWIVVFLCACVRVCGCRYILPKNIGRTDANTIQMRLSKKPICSVSVKITIYWTLSGALKVLVFRLKIAIFCSFKRFTHFPMPNSVCI